MLDRYLDKLKLANRDIRLFRKIMKLMSKLPYPGELKNLIRTSVAFSNPKDGMDYFRRLYYAVCNEKPDDLKKTAESEIHSERNGNIGWTFQKQRGS